MTSGSASSTTYGHLCVAYDDPAALDARAVAHLAAGLAAGEQVWLVGPGDPDVLAGRLARLPGRDTALSRRALRLVPVERAYRHDEIVDPEKQVRAYAAATRDALAAGYTGLRVVAEATALVRSPAQRAAFARYEHLIDHWMRRHPMSAVCAYDRRELGDAAIAELACMHPETNADVLFRLHAGGGDAVVELGGELDPSNHRLFAAALDRADPRPVGGRLVFEAAGLRFVDHRCLLHLRDHARRHDATAVLRTSHSAAARLVELLDLTEVRVEVVR
ncbi:STAS domain-containing protein [Micromonospora terminaliae]|uniref:STAS domain-containing protein n=1 Tax=Micromonospora terminaliae TaxID=1914461 RepID=A0AAJ3DM54_9ACTN|nr:MEDS domain-containing protein [Micromonospora terminaliae]NES31577.1 STAS domain-containing protein [Micromonospora terminaliae]QGL46232.1 STAS domain-containing protein [Micromonospora terminaliae]